MFGVCVDARDGDPNHAPMLPKMIPSLQLAGLSTASLTQQEHNLDADTAEVKNPSRSAIRLNRYNLHQPLTFPVQLRVAL